MENFFGIFPRHGKYFSTLWKKQAKFSTVWKIFSRIFHTMDKILAIFPRYGKFFREFSTVWKTQRKGRVYGVAAAVVGTPSLAAQDRDAIDLAFILCLAAWTPCLWRGKRYSAVFRLFSRGCRAERARPDHEVCRDEGGAGKGGRRRGRGFNVQYSISISNIQGGTTGNGR